MSNNQQTFDLVLRKLSQLRQEVQPIFHLQQEGTERRPSDLLQGDIEEALAMTPSSSCTDVVSCFDTPASSRSFSLPPTPHKASMSGSSESTSPASVTSLLSPYPYSSSMQTTPGPNSITSFSNPYSSNIKPVRGVTLPHPAIFGSDYRAVDLENSPSTWEHASNALTENGGRSFGNNVWAQSNGERSRKNSNEIYDGDYGVIGSMTEGQKRKFELAQAFQRRELMGKYGDANVYDYGRHGLHAEGLHGSQARIPLASIDNLQPLLQPHIHQRHSFPVMPQSSGMVFGSSLSRFSEPQFQLQSSSVSHLLPVPSPQMYSPAQAHHSALSQPSGRTTFYSSPLNESYFPSSSFQPPSFNSSASTSPQPTVTFNNYAPVKVPAHEMPAMGTASTAATAERYSKEILELLSEKDLNALAANHGGRAPNVEQINPFLKAEKELSIKQPSIINTGNQGPMVMQPGDWHCGVCGFVNWRRRKVCFRCFPFAGGNDKEIGALIELNSKKAALLAAGHSPSSISATLPPLGGLAKHHVPPHHTPPKDRRVRSIAITAPTITDGSSNAKADELELHHHLAQIEMARIKRSHTLPNVNIMQSMCELRLQD
ncbi:hypothetical protein BT69DRAFT_709709 [Atractiella rhizophila]|nr:hypothetical protein BT69DRAFT_709709 [Atractiella rhizophila]